MPASGDRESQTVPYAGGHRGVERIARILELAAANPDGVRLVDAASTLDAPRSSVHSLLRGLVAVGYLAERDGRYVIGRSLHALLAPHHTSWLVDLAGDELRGLSRQTGETALPGIRISDSIVYIFQAEGDHSIHYTATLGERRMIYPTSIGKLFLAGMDRRALDDFYRANAGLDRAEVEAELEQSRRDRIAYNREETVKGVTAAAAAIRGPGGSILAAISVVGPVYRMSDALPHVAHRVSQVADRLTALARTSPYAPRST